MSRGRLAPGLALAAVGLVGLAALVVAFRFAAGIPEGP